MGVCFIARIDHDRVKVKFVRRSRVRRHKASALIKRMREYTFLNISDCIPALWASLLASAPQLYAMMHVSSLLVFACLS